MKKNILLISLLIIAITGAYYIITAVKNKTGEKRNANLQAEPDVPVNTAVLPGAATGSPQLSETANIVKPELVSPLDKPSERIRLKKFGDYITPENSPVSPERFRGYHTGVDFEVFPEELSGAVEVKAMCGGNILLKKWVSGYGGVLVTACELAGEPVTVLYGHLSLASIDYQIGDSLMAGEVFGRLGADNSRETDGERKHLHLSIHRGKTVNLKGYVNTEAELKDWIDPCNYICNL